MALSVCRGARYHEAAILPLLTLHARVSGSLKIFGVVLQVIEQDAKALEALKAMFGQPPELEDGEAWLCIHWA
jgi:hypothetical protein